MSITEFLRFSKHHAGHALSLAVGIGTLAGFLLILQAWCLAEIIDGVIFEKQEVKQLLPWFWALLTIFLLRALLAW
ncbi:MAG: thiol reductant ABC exporter subunit CydD, partial [Chromatiales bacterium]